MDFDKNIASSMPAVDVGSISSHLEIPNKIIEKHGNGADEIMDVLSDEDIDKEIEDPERIKSASDALQVMDKVIWFFYQFDNKALLESFVKVIESTLGRFHRTSKASIKMQVKIQSPWQTPHSR